MPKALVGLWICVPIAAAAQAPEIALREFASGQIKKGVRSIGFGGDGATWGNYSLVYRDAGGALVDGGLSAYANGNEFSFTAVGFTSPKLWHDLAIYVIALSQQANDAGVSLAAPMRGNGANQALFLKAALPLGYGFSAGILLSYESSQFDLIPEDGPGFTHFDTRWRPSGGFGVTWQPHERVLLGTRFIINNDLENRTDPSGTVGGLYRTYEERVGGSVSLWRGGILDAGATARESFRGLDGTSRSAFGPNLGIEQAFFDRGLVLRAGYDESSPTAGVSVRVKPFNLDVAYVYNLGKARIGSVFGTSSSSVLATLTYDYTWRPQLTDAR